MPGSARAEGAGTDDWSLPVNWMNRFRWMLCISRRRLRGPLQDVRLGSDIDADVDTALMAALRKYTEPIQLIDHESGQRFVIEPSFIDEYRSWTIDRYDQNVIDHAMTDLQLGAQVSALPYTRFTYTQGWLAVLDRAATLEPGDGRPAQSVDEPELEPPQRLQFIQFLSEAGLTQVSSADARELATQLSRAEPLP